MDLGLQLSWICEGLLYEVFVHVTCIIIDTVHGDSANYSVISMNDVHTFS